MVECDFEMEGSLRQRMIWGRLDVAKDPGWTLRVVNFSAKLMVVKTHVIILMMIKFRALQMPRFSTCRSLRKGSQESRYTRMNYECLKTC